MSILKEIKLDIIFHISSFLICILLLIGFYTLSVEKFNVEFKSKIDRALDTTIVHDIAESNLYLASLWLIKEEKTDGNSLIFFDYDSNNLNNYYKQLLSFNFIANEISEKYSDDKLIRSNFRKLMKKYYYPDDGKFYAPVLISIYPYTKTVYGF